MTRPTAKAFTLAELLIALGILGIIATFTIPKVLTSQANSKKAAVFKETIAAINGALYNGVVTGELNRDNVTTYMLSHMNAVKICTSNSQTENCWTQSSSHPSNKTEPGFVLHNGATVCGVHHDWGADGHEEIEIDWNGSEGPNVEGDDQMGVDLCYDTGADCADSRKKPGTATPYNYSTTASTALYQSIFSGT